MKKKILKYSLLMFGIIVTASCSSSDEESNPSLAQLITAHPWRLDKYKIGSEQETDYDDCSKDDKLTFFINGIQITEYLGVSCFGETGTDQTTWTVDEDIRQISVTDNNETDILEIINLNNNEMILKFTPENNEVVITKFIKF